MTNNIKSEYYDNFRCLADRCPFTCCLGWEISIDSETYSRWEEDKISGYLNGARLKKHNKKTEYFLRMHSGSGCMFLDHKGLCSIVKERGEAYQPKTCRDFPRLLNCIDGVNELSLSFACPAVVDIIKSFNTKVDFISKNLSVISDRSCASILRAVMLNILQSRNRDIKDKFLIIFHLLLSVREDQSAAREIIKKYRKADYRSALVNAWRGAESDSKDSYMEVNELFLDISMNYRKVESYKKYLEDIYGAAEETITEGLIDRWKHFKESFGTNGLLLENIFASKIYGECIHDNIDNMIISFQKLIVEYVMIRYSVFLKWRTNRNSRIQSEEKPTVEVNINYETLKDYIVVYSRIIGYNEEGMKEFWEESFDEAIWEFGYMLLLLS